MDSTLSFRCSAAALHSDVKNASPDSDIHDPPNGEIQRPFTTKHLANQEPGILGVQQVREATQSVFDTVLYGGTQLSAKPCLLRSRETELVAPIQDPRRKRSRHGTTQN